MILISLIVYTIFFISTGVLSDFLKYIQFNEIHRIIIVLLFFFLDCAFCAPIINKTITFDLKNGSNMLKFTYIILWILILATFPLIVAIPLEMLLSIWILLFVIYILIKIFVYKKNFERPLEKIIKMFSKIDFAITLIILMLITGFQLFKGIQPLHKYTKTTVAYFVGYEQVKTNDLYIENYPKFSYEVNKTQYISTTKNPVFFKIFDVRNEKKIKIMYKENNPNYYVFIKNQAIGNIIGGIFSFLIMISFTIFYIKYKKI